MPTLAAVRRVDPVVARVVAVEVEREERNEKRYWSSLA
jgi:hypothetical protein